MGGKKESMERFTGNNFHTWQTRLRFLLQKKELWKVIDTDDALVPITREARAQWDVLDTKTLAIIALNLGDEYLHHISNLSTTKEAWKILNHLFGATGKNAKINLKLQLFKLTLKPGTPFPIHLNEFKGLLTQLASIKATVDEEDSIALLLKSMPEEYDVVVTTLLNMPSLKLQDVVSSLMDEYKKKQRREDEVTEEQLYFSKSNNYKANGRNNKFKWKKGKATGPGCGFCGKPGHKEEDCFHKKKAQKAYLASIVSDSEEGTPDEEASKEEANVASFGAKDEDDEWAF